MDKLRAHILSTVERLSTLNFLGKITCVYFSHSLFQPRLAMNSVICGDYQRPLNISAFLSHVAAGFRLLNLKNDFLRKKFDSLKYDVKKVEEIVYDLSIRKFNE